MINELKCEKIKFKCTVSLAKIDKKIDEKNYTGMATDKVSCVAARQGQLHKSWIKVEDITLSELLNYVMNKHPFSATYFKGCYSDVWSKTTSYSTSDEYIVNKTKNGDFVNSKRTRQYDNEYYLKSKHVMRRNKNFESVQLLVIDIDYGYNTIEEVRNDINNSPLGSCSFIYTTPSHSDTQVKLRVGWLLDEPLTDDNLYRNLVSGLIRYFKGDEQCKDSSRYFFYGKELIYVNDEVSYKVEQFQSFLDLLSVKKIKPKTVKQKTSDIKNNVEIELEDNSMIKLGDYFKSLGYDYDTDEGCIRNFDFDAAITDSELFSECTKKRISHNDMFRLATHVIWIKGGMKWLNAQIELHSGDSIQKRLEMVKQVKKERYAPVNFNRDNIQMSEVVKNDCLDNEFRNYFEIFAPIRNYKRNIEIMSDYNREEIELIEAEKMLQTHFKQALSQQTQNNTLEIHIVKCPTGLGKTRQLVNDVDEYGFVVAAPTHELKDEIVERTKDVEIFDGIFSLNSNGYVSFDTARQKETVSSVKMSKLSAPVQQKIDYLYKVGLTGEVSKMLNVIKRGGDIGVDYTVNDIEIVLSYKQSMLDTFNTDRTVHTTHTMALTGAYNKHHTVIFDEDPLYSIFKMGYFSGSDLSKIITAGENSVNNIFRTFINKIKESIKSAVGTEIIMTPHFDNDTKKGIIDELVNNQIYNSRIAAFLFSNSFCLKLDTKEDYEMLKNSTNFEYAITKGLRYVHRTNLPNKKIIILSATINPDIYKRAFGADKVFVYDMPYVKPVGMVIQDTTYSFSKASLSRPNTQKYLSKNVNFELDTISFNGYKYTNCDLYFFNLVGYDELKGRNINVIGTPELAPWSYVLLAKCIGYDVINIKQDYVYQAVEWDGLRFYFNTFEDKDLRNLMLSMITGEITQAIGRNRYLREDSIVNLYSGLPIYGAKQLFVK